MPIKRLSSIDGSITGSTGVLTGTSYSLTNSGSVSAILGGAVALTKTGLGTVVLSGYEPVRADGTMVVRGVRVSPIDGTRASVDGRLEITVPTFHRNGERARVGAEVVIHGRCHVLTFGEPVGVRGQPPGSNVIKIVN